MTRRDLGRIERAAARAIAAREQRDAIIREVHPRHTVREIAKAAGLSAARVGQIIKQQQQQGEKGQQ